MSAEALLLIAGGTVVGAKLLGDKAAPPAASKATGTATPQGATSLRDYYKSKTFTSANGSGIKAAPSVAPASSYLQQNPTTSTTKDVASKLEAEAKAAWSKLSGDAKKAACQKLKAEYPNSPEIQALNCNAPVFQAMVAAAGAAVGTAACGPACGALGVVAASYVGPKVEEWAKDAYEQGKDWAEDAWDSISFW
jgi:hypothetical protein